VVHIPIGAMAPASASGHLRRPSMAAGGCSASGAKAAGGCLAACSASGAKAADGSLAACSASGAKAAARLMVN